MEIDEKGDKEIRTEKVIDNVKQVEKDLELTDDEDEEEDGESSLQIRKETSTYLYTPF